VLNIWCWSYPSVSLSCCCHSLSSHVPSKSEGQQTAKGIVHQTLDASAFAKISVAGDSTLKTAIFNLVAIIIPQRLFIFSSLWKFLKGSEAKKA
jgi:hypothetical protein